MRAAPAAGARRHVDAGVRDRHRRAGDGAGRRAAPASADHASGARGAHRRGAARRRRARARPLARARTTSSGSRCAPRPTCCRRPRAARAIERRWAAAAEHVADRSAGDSGGARCALASALVKVARLTPPVDADRRADQRARRRRRHHRARAAPATTRRSPTAQPSAALAALVAIAALWRRGTRRCCRPSTP